MKIKLITLFFVLASSFESIFAVSGTCGNNLTWDLSNGVLTISGTGAMYDYTYGSKAPWDSYNTSIHSVVIDDGVATIGEMAFIGCGMSSVAISQSVKTIGNRAFLHCAALTSVVIPDSVTVIGESSFSRCSALTSVTLGNSVSQIGFTAFASCTALPSITIPNSVTSIDSQVFQNCPSLTSVTIGTGLTRLAELAFYQCDSLTSVTINSNAVANMYYIYAFFGQQVTNYIIGEDVSSIGSLTFANCRNLKSVTIGSHVTNIGANAFSSCAALSSLTCLAPTPPSMGNAVFDQLDCSQITLYVPKAYIAAYRTADQWKNLNIKSVEGAYSVAFLNWDSTLLLDLLVPEDSIPVYTGTTPTRQSDRYAYTFSKWTPDIKAATEDAIYIATFNRKLITCTISSNSVNGIVDGVGEYLPGTVVELTAIPNEGYLFSKWSDDIFDNPRSVVLSSDTTFDAIFVPAHDADSVEATVIMVSSMDSTANVVWPSVEGAATYELLVKDQNGNEIYTLVFDEEGKLISLHFNAPGLNAPQQTYASGFSFILEGFELGETYYLWVTAKDQNGSILDIKTMSFITGAGVQQDLESLSVPTQKVHKLLRNGQIYILRGDKTYTLTGEQIN